MINRFFLGAAKYRQLALLLLVATLPHLAARPQNQPPDKVTVAAERPGAYLPLLYGKKVAVVANQTSRAYDQHLVDYLLDREVAVTKVFAPEHGFRGQASAGAKVADGRDAATGLPIISLYGDNRKPTPGQLAGVEVILFDIQDVGVRFYTYISTLSLVMEAAAEADIEVVVLDRPNPNGYYVDGPVLEAEFSSFVGMHPVPVVHGLTVGEYARMVNGEGWLSGGRRCDLHVVRCKGYSHDMHYELPVAPSPNLPNAAAVTLYPSLAFFEGTPVSIGRGTERPFQVVGAPWFADSNTVFTPEDRPGAEDPKFEGRQCLGYDLREFAQFYLRGMGKLYLYWLEGAYAQAPDQGAFFRPYFDLLAGTDRLRKQIAAGTPVAEIRAGWQEDLEAYRQRRERYLLYPDF